MPRDSEKQERSRLWLEREEEIAAASRKAALRLPGLKLINSDGKAMEPADWEGRRPRKMPDNDCGVSLLGAIRRIVAKGHDGERLLAQFAKKHAFHIYNTHAEGREAYESAVNILRQAGIRNLIEAEGFHEATGTRSSVTQREWQDWRLDGWRNRLIDPTDGTTTITNVWIKNAANATKPIVANKDDSSRSRANTRNSAMADRFSRKEAARYLTAKGYRIAPQTLANLASRKNAGGGPPFTRVGSVVTYDRRDLDAWVAQRTA